MLILPFKLILVHFRFPTYLFASPFSQQLPQTPPPSPRQRASEAQDPRHRQSHAQNCYKGVDPVMVRAREFRVHSKGIRRNSDGFQGIQRFSYSSGHSSYCTWPNLASAQVTLIIILEMVMMVFALIFGSGIAISMQDSSDRSVARR